MNDSEVIKRLKNLFNAHELDLPETESLEVLHTAIAALEKQIPKKPTTEGDGYDNKGEQIYDTWICPNCEERYEIDYEEHDHCPSCGQKIDWNELREV